jgi:hypothetical protein
MLKNLSVSAILASTLLAPIALYAAGLDDITGYQSPVQAGASVKSYTTDEIISILPSSLNDNGIYIGGHHGVYGENWVDYEDPRALALDEEKFGECDAYYIRMDLSYGGIAFTNTLRYLFPESEEKKVRAISDLKDAMKYLADPGNLHYSSNKCADRDKYSVQLKEILNAVIQAAPTILKEKQRMVEMAKAAKTQEQNQVKEKAREKQQAGEKAEADRQALALAERKGAEERANELRACQATNEYKLYDISSSIENNQLIARSATLEMQRQKEGAKISGYVDKQVMYEMGNRVAGANRLNKEKFEVYKKLGGAARNVESVKTLPNPCPQ